MNKQLVYTILFSFLFIFLGIDANAQDSTKVEAWDRSHVDYRSASIEKMEAYKLMSEYSYDRYKKPEGWWSKFKRWIWSQFIKTGINSHTVIYILIGLAVLILLFVVLKLLGVNIDGLFIFSQNTKVTNLNFKQSDENIYDENLEKALTTLIKNKAYREAVRIMYLLSLRHLDSSELIDWKPWKTNKEYYYELTSKEQRVLFKNIVLMYEYIWYGQFTIEEEKFNTVQSEFNQFEQTIANKITSA